MEYFNNLIGRRSSVSSGISLKIELNTDMISECSSIDTTGQSLFQHDRKNLEIEKENETILNPSPNCNPDYSFQSFIKKYQGAKLNLSASWNKEKEYYLKDQNNKKKIILKEINQFDCNDPLNVLDESYVKDIYNTNLLVNELRTLESIFNERTYMAIIEKKGNLEMIKKIIDYYLNYVVEMNFDLIMKALKKLNLIEINLDMSFNKVSESKRKMESIKSNFLLSSSKFLLMKQKLKNLLKIHTMIKEKLLKWYNLFQQSKKLKLANKYSLLWNNLVNIRNEVHSWSTSGSGNNSKEFKKRNLLINQVLLQKSKDKLNKLQNNIEKQINNIFLERKENFLDLYEYFMLNPSHSVDKFMDLLESVYKKTIFNIIKGTLVSFTDETKSFLAQDVNRIRDIARLKFDDSKFIQGMNQLVKNLSKICQSYQIVIDLSKGNSQLNSKIISKNNTFYEKLEKKYSKVLQCFSNFIRELNYKNMMYLVIYNCLFSELIKFYFNVDYSKYLAMNSKTQVLESIKFKNIQNIKKVGILLGGDNWKRAALQDYNEFFSQSKLQEKMSFSVRNYLTIFNDCSTYVNKNNIKEVFNKYMEVFVITTVDKTYHRSSTYSNSVSGNIYSNLNISNLSSSQTKVVQNFNLFSISEDTNIKIEILSKSLNNKTIILSSSTITMIKYLVDLIVDLAFFDSLTYEIFLQIFNLVDYYILASLNMFTDKKYLVQLFEEINLEETKKKNRYEQNVELILFQKRFSSLRKYLNSTKKSLEVLFEVEIDLIKSNYENNENYESGEFYLPKQNSQIIINDNNIYSCMIESIILYESLVSVKKILKRLTHFTKKIELEFQSKLVTDYIKNYDRILEEIKIFLYKPICQNIFKLDPIMNKINNYKWDPKETDNDFEFSEANPFIDNLFQEISEKYDKLYLLSAGSLTEKSQLRFLDAIIIHVIEKLLEAFSKIKKCNSCGRSIMLKDIKFLKSKIEHKFGRDYHNVFGELELYINSWYCSEDEFLKYIEDTHLNYKFLNGILNTGQNFTKLSRQQRKDFNSRLDDTYITIMENIKISMLE